MAVALVAAAPGLLVMLFFWLPKHLIARPEQMHGFSGWSVELLSLFRVFVNQFTRYSLENLSVALLTTVFMACVLAGLIQHGRRHWRRAEVSVPFAGILGTLLLLLLLFWGTDKTLASFSVPRYGVFMLPCLAVMFAHMAMPVRHRPFVVLGGVALILTAGLIPRLHPASFDQPWANHGPSHASALKLETIESLDVAALLVIVGEEPGMIGITLSSAPKHMPTIHAPSATDMLPAILHAQQVHLRPVPWLWGDDRPPFPAAYTDVLKRHGFEQTSVLVWEKTGSVPQTTNQP